jgi:hypothetical protein
MSPEALQALLDSFDSLTQAVDTPIGQLIKEQYEDSAVYMYVKPVQGSPKKGYIVEDFLLGR